MIIDEDDRRKSVDAAYKYIQKKKEEKRIPADAILVTFALSAGGILGWLFHYMTTLPKP